MTRHDEPSWSKKDRFERQRMIQKVPKDEFKVPKRPDELLGLLTGDIINALMEYRQYTIDHLRHAEANGHEDIAQEMLDMKRNIESVITFIKEITNAK